MAVDEREYDLSLADTIAVPEFMGPLVVDIDGTLLKTDLLFESYLSPFPIDITHHRKVAMSLRKGKAALKQYLAERGSIDYDTLPFNNSVIDLIKATRAMGRPIYLASASDQRHADELASRLGFFDGVFASDGVTNLSGTAKADRLVAAFGAQGFDYVGNSADDLPVWSQARRCYAIDTSSKVSRALESGGVPYEHLARGPQPSMKAWIKAIRVHQWAKNSLVLVPLFTSHSYRLSSITLALLAMLAFSACASGVYILNDLLDLKSDRSHPRKRMRPFASGTLPITHGVLASGFLLGFSAVVALSVSLTLAAVLFVYFVLTTAYSLLLKRKMMIDVVMLASLYTIRVIGGAIAIDVRVSEWLLAFSMFVFLSLALIKRYVELRALIESNLPDPVSRNYKLHDAPVVAALASSSGFNAVTIFTLYIASPDVQALYPQPQMLWLLCPLLIYWLARSLMMAHRGAMDDDPLIFALRDRVSRVTILLMLLLAALAAW